MHLTKAVFQIFRQIRKGNFNLNVDYIKNEIIYKKANEVNFWYTKIIGLQEVKLCQDKVVLLQDKLLDAQEKRRQINQQLVEIRKRSNELQEQIHKVKRQDDLQRFLELMKEETEVLKQEQNYSKVLSDYDRDEREIFTAFTNAIRESHEKQRAQIEYSKYLGLVLSIISSFLVFLYSTFSRESIRSNIKRNANVITSSTLPLLEELKKNQTKLNGHINQIHNENEKIMSLIIASNMDATTRHINTTASVQAVDNSFEIIPYPMKVGLGVFLALILLKSLT